MRSATKQRSSKPRTKSKGEDYSQIRLEDMQPLSPSESAKWARATRPVGRPKTDAKDRAARVMITISPKLLREADELAKLRMIGRSELIANAIRHELGGLGSLGIEDLMSLRRRLKPTEVHVVADFLKSVFVD